ncbi:MAG: hypothetical protein ABSG44_09295 [Thermodesulfobacteriota bacterium]|jgi:hypothetical protein
MHSILLVVERPASASKDPSKRTPAELAEVEHYGNTVIKLRELKNKNKDIQALTENVLLIPIDDTLEPLAEAIHNLTGVSYRYTIFDEVPKWNVVAKKD